MSIAERIKILISQEGSQSHFCRKTGISTSALSNILMRNSGISSGNLEQIARAYPNLNLRWLLMGQEPRWTDGTASPTPAPASVQEVREPRQIYERLVSLLENRVRELERALKRIDPEEAERLGIK